jgi:hypothetical protein
MVPPRQANNNAWFCVEEISNVARPIILLAAGTLQECHQFIERYRAAGQASRLRVNYSPAMRKFLARTTADAA